MAVSFVSANAAYRAAGGMGGGIGEGGAALGAQAPSQNFGNMLADTMKEAIGNMRAGEAAAAQGAAGKGDIVQVVNAVTAAELTLETVVAVRDKVISAYQDIMRMPI
jgi:flagellar hook-basal body complex protein FliE